MASKDTLHILLVENDSFVMDATTLMLERMSYTVHGKTTSLDALTTFSDSPDKFDLAIIEPLMPKLMGLELAVRLRSIRQDLPVLFYTGYLEPSLEQAISESGIGQTIFKPLYSRELSEAIQERLNLASPHIC